MAAKFNISFTEDEMRLIYLMTVLSYDSVLAIEASLGYFSSYSDFRKRIRDLRDKLELEDFKDVP